MTDAISMPKLPVDWSEALEASPDRLQQRLLNSKNGTPEGSVSDTELVDTCHQMESLFINHLFKYSSSHYGEGGQSFLVACSV